MAAGAAGGLKEVLRHLMQHKRVLILSIVVALVPWMLQMMYWKLITGHFITFAYGKKGEHFEWDKMVPGMVLFSVRNGWLVYSPLLIPALGMLVTMAWKKTACGARHPAHHRPHPSHLQCLVVLVAGHQLRRPWHGGPLRVVEHSACLADPCRH